VRLLTKKIEVRWPHLPYVSISDMCANPISITTLPVRSKEQGMTGSILYFDPGFQVDFPTYPVMFPTLNMDQR
jgi:hypothetical protein